MTTKYMSFVNALVCPMSQSKTSPGFNKDYLNPYDSVSIQLRRSITFDESCDISTIYLDKTLIKCQTHFEHMNPFLLMLIVMP